MSGGWRFEDDLAVWRRIATESHARPSGRTNIYARAQWVIEAWAHRRLARWAAPHARVLEIGIGGGEHVPFERTGTADRLYIGFDRDAGFAGMTSRQFGLPIVVGDGAALPFATGAFDAVVAASVLEHVSDLDRCLAEIARVLRPGGELLVIVPTNGSLAIAAFKAVMTYPFMRWRGIRRPALIWHYENVNHFLRIAALLRLHFDVREEVTAPLPLPWRLAPMALFRCGRRAGADA